jgi:glycosyltransferase involved in cell wall biosynthesis
LIIGQTFTTDTGGGITLSCLFKGWPKEKLAIAVESKEALDLSKCSNYYRLGFNELKMPFPFSLAQRKTKSGLVSENASVGAVTISKNSRLKQKLKNSFDALLDKSGLFLWVYGRQYVSQSFLHWVKAFNPDVIYYQPNSYKSISFVLELQRTIQKPLVSHVMDDWFSFAVKPSPLYAYWQKQLAAKVQHLFGATQLHLSICDYMSQAYGQRYGHKFYAFHNAVEIGFWERYAGSDATSSGPFRILYAGRVGYGIDDTLLKVGNIIENMGKQNRQVLLEIQTKDQDHPVLQALAHHKHVKVTDPIAYEELPRKFAQADALLIPCDFEGDGVRFIKYSMPTKVSEYMATGTPILVIGPSDTALLQYARQGWAHVCDTNKAADMEQAIIDLLESPALRSRIASRARELAAKNHDQTEIIRQFRGLLMDLLPVREQEAEEQVR